MEKDIEGILQQARGPRLTMQELLVLDFVLTHPMQAGYFAYDEYIKWSSVRRLVWCGIDEMDGALRRREEAVKKLPSGSKKPGVPLWRLELTPSEAEILLMLIPPTMQLGSDEDSGFSLKLKLSRYLEGKEEADADDTDKAQGETSAPG